MGLALSLILAITVLALRLKIQSKVLKTDSEDKQRLAKTIQNPTWLIVIIGGGLIIAGFLYPPLYESGIAVGFMLWATAIMLLIQGESLKRSGEQAKAYSRKVNIYSNIFFYVGIPGIVAIAVSLIIALVRAC